MNWYSLFKIAQIWNMPSDTFEDKLKALYELEYKYSMLTSKPFSGIPERHQNILENVEGRLYDVAIEVKDELLKTIGLWLEGHALLSPITWANKRAEDVADEDLGSSTRDMFVEMLSEYKKYSNADGKYARNIDFDIEFLKLLSQACRNLNNFPKLRVVLNGYMEDHKEYLRQESREVGLEEFGQMYNKKFETEEQVEDFIDSLTLDDIDIENYIYDTESFLNLVESTGYVNEVLSEFYKAFVFPHWAKFWRSKGIAKTRKNVEKVYNILSDATGDIKSLMAAISLGLNVAHQNGHMLDYLEQNTGSNDLRVLLDSLTKGEHVKEWNQQLNEIGVQIKGKQTIK
jgi:hypothetical protein